MGASTFYKAGPTEQDAWPYKQNHSCPTSTRNHSRVADAYDDGYLRVEYDNYYVACGGKRISLPLKEFLVFARLARNADRVVSSDEIWRCAWGETPFNSLSLRVHVHRLRRTFEPFGLRIESMVGVGYCLSVDYGGESSQSRVAGVRD